VANNNQGIVSIDLLLLLLLLDTGAVRQLNLYVNFTTVNTLHLMEGAQLSTWLLDVK
jgi:hypothetical protein